MFFTLLEFVLYLGCFLTAYFYPETIEKIPTEAGILQDVIVGCLLSALVLAIAIHRHIVIYDRKQKELESTNDQLQGLNRMKTEFLQDIKHEIKNPLLAISLGVDLACSYIGEKEKTEEVSAALAVVQNEALRVGRMISGMVELATMSGNAMSRDKADLAAMLRVCAETSRLPIEKKNNKLHISIADNLPPVYAGTEQLERVSINLLTNAMESTQDGDITLEAYVEKNYITVRVCDTGEGVPPELLPRVFKRGVSGKDGKGYGLSICKTIVEAHGGDIEIESIQGKGTAVTFTIPVYSGQNEARKDGL